MKTNTILTTGLALIVGFSLTARGQELPQPGARGNADNVPFIGRSDRAGNPVRLVKASGHVSNYDEAKVAAYTLPDPLKMADGAAVATRDEWLTKRRPEVLKFYQTEIYGRVPENAPKVTWEVTQTDEAARGGTAVMRRVVGRVGDKADGPRLNLTIYTSNKAAGKKSPVLLNVTFGGPVGAGRGPGGFDLPGATLERGWAYATIGYGDIQPDRAERWREGVIGQMLKEGQTRPAADEWGTISAWAWGISRCVDFLAADAAIDPKGITVAGVSRLGKTVLWAGAQDERIAAVCSIVPGEMGASLIRRDWGETLDDMAQNFSWQFAGNLQKWVGKWNDLPVDQHMLIALCGPRAVFVTGGKSDQWSDPKGEFLALVGAGPVYRLLGAKDLGTTELPEFDKPVVSGSLGFHYHSGGHAATPADWTSFFDFAERAFATEKK